MIGIRVRSLLKFSSEEAIVDELCVESLTEYEGDCEFEEEDNNDEEEDEIVKNVLNLFQQEGFKSSERVKL